MKNFILLLIASLSLVSCNVISGNGDVRDEKRDVSNFQAVKTSGSIDVEIKSGDNYTLTVQNDENLLSYIVTEVNNGILKIHYKNGYSISNDHAKVFVTAPSFDKIITSGSGNVVSNGVIKNARQIEFNLSGSGDVDAGVEAPSIKVSGYGSGNVKLSGRTKDFDCRMSGSGDVNCANLKSENTTVSIAGSGNAHVFASVHLTARISGSGNIYYLGNPQSPEIHVAGSGTVQQQK
jgi:predicted small secreted protein